LLFEDDPISAEVEHPVRSILDQQLSSVKAANIYEEHRISAFKAGLSHYRWKNKGSEVMETIMTTTQKIWQKSSNMDFQSNKQLKLVCFIMIAVTILLMQVRLRLHIV
jgi:hypothetical protein